MIALVYPLGLLLAMRAGGCWLWSLVPLNILLVPALDHAVMTLAPRWRLPRPMAQVVFAPLAFWLYGLSQAGVLTLTLFYLRAHQLSPALFAGLVSSTGIMTGTAGITAAHELVHRRSRMERGLGLSLLAMVSYMHFRIEHVYGHHRHVGTARDPGTAAFGEHYPNFFARSMVRGFSSAWRIETARLKRHDLPAWSARNRVLHYAAIQALIYFLILAALGWTAVAFFALQSLMAVHLLEAVNYVQHYGLRRAAAGTAAVERVSAMHSWDGYGPVSGLLSFNIGIHAHHHLNAGLGCDELSVSEQAPRLPYSFFLMVFVALIPPLWHRLMDKRVVALLADPTAPPRALARTGLIHAT